MRSGRFVISMTVLLALAGIAVSSYLAWASYQHDILVCGVGDCSAVQSSEYAEVAGVSIAWLGVAMYAAILALVWARWRFPTWSDIASGGILFVSICGTLFSAWLTYLEIWVIEAVCQWCVVSAIIIATIMVLEAAQFWRSEPRNPE